VLHRGAATLTGLVALALASCAKESGPPDYGGRRPVILISIDSLRADRCTPYGHVPEQAPAEQTTPFLARMAAEGVLFERASSASPWTLPSHMSLLSGMHPREHGVRLRTQRAGDGLELLSGRLRGAGYQTAGFFSGPFLHPVWGFGHGFDVYQPGADYLADDENTRVLAGAWTGEAEGVHNLSHADKECAAQVMGKALSWLEKKDRYREPFFLFLHLWDPHYDYFPPADYRRRFLPQDDGSIVGDELLKADVPLTDELRAGLLALYDAEIRYTDDWMATLDAKLQEWGIADDVILLVTSDHGDEFLEHGNRGHHLTLYEEVMHVPMILRAPGLAPAGRRIQGSVSINDAAATLLDLAGVPGWPERSGRSLRTLWTESDRDFTVRMDLLRPAQKIQLLGWREGAAKLIFDSAAAQGLVFDLGADPAELSPGRFGPRDADPVLRRGLEALGAEPRTPPFPPGAAAEPAHVSSALSQVGYADDR
jgi:arylsulfatase A-like enzyme